MSKNNNAEPMQPEVQAAGLKLDVNVRPIAPMGNLLAFANVTVGDCFKIDGFRICSGKTVCMSTCRPPRISRENGGMCAGR